MASASALLFDPVGRAAWRLSVTCRTLLAASCWWLSSWAPSACLVVCAVSHGVSCFVRDLCCCVQPWVSQTWAKHDRLDQCCCCQPDVGACQRLTEQLPKPSHTTGAQNHHLNQSKFSIQILTCWDSTHIDLLGQHTKAAGQDSRPHNNRAAAVHVADGGAHASAAMRHKAALHLMIHWATC